MTSNRINPRAGSFTITHHKEGARTKADVVALVRQDETNIPEPSVFIRREKRVGGPGYRTENVDVPLTFVREPIPGWAIWEAKDVPTNVRMANKVGYSAKATNPKADDVVWFQEAGKNFKAK